MMLKFRLFANFREKAGKKEIALDVNGDTVMDAVRALIEAYPGLEPLMLQEGKIKPYVNVLVNGRRAEPSDRVKDGDELAIFPPVSGG
ncbi:molybdopterin synthase subunit MoaD [Methanocella conradii HZ254]|uniref:Molybdopterin synthase subunit MoaD n=1 Tax=Methanocella conradii (strain DSM 24694 / JCM 17849 / CGMCC 1.5162 / HZ254) TaxID=1041930 RepID=H8IAG4_METCZ|nr:ubiquitin-like small modifier protein 1 [Methanocella conradii]AFC99638.1 molybdopterin synthase subunit MoaD [Methanocella conradii HZ254]MDI6897480.1 MoaD family protein [Methanocella conradii]